MEKIEEWKNKLGLALKLRDGELGERKSLKESERERIRERLSVTEMRGKHGMGLPIPEITLPTPKYLKSLSLTVALPLTHARIGMALSVPKTEWSDGAVSW